MSTVIGTFQKTGNGFKGNIRTLTLNLPEVILAKIEGPKSKETLPDFRITLAGLERGAGWRKTYEDGKKVFISASVDGPDLNLEEPLNFSLFERKDGKGYDAVWSRAQRNN